MIGRKAELATVLGHLEAHRLVTLHAPGGTGKTTLALAAADHAGAAAVARLADAGGGPRQVMASAIGSAIGVPGLVWPAVADALGDQPLLLVLDNVEGQEGLGEDVVALLAAAGGLRILATGQTRLGCPGECVLPLAPLGVPAGDDLEAIGSCDAGLLYLTRAAEPPVAGEAAAVAELLRVLEGVPLAVELAAARSAVLGPAELTERLRADVAVLRRRGASGRHASLAAALDWTLGLVSDGACMLFARLGVFHGGWTADRALVICDAAPDALAELADVGLVRADGGRWTWPEAVAAHARAALAAAGETAWWQRRHAEAMRDAALAGFAEDDGEGRGLAMLAGEDANLLVALHWAAGHDPALHVELCGALGWWSYQRGQTIAVAEHARQAAGVLPPSAAARVRLDLALMDLEWSAGDLSAAARYADAAMAAVGVIGDPELTALAARLTIGCAAWEGSVKKATERTRIARESSGLPAPGLDGWIAMAHLISGDTDEGERWLDRRDAAAGDDGDSMIAVRGDVARQRDDFTRAVVLYARALEHALARGARGPAIMRLSSIAMSAAATRPAEAVRLDAAVMRLAAIEGYEPVRLPVWRAWRDQHLAPARTVLGPAAAAHAEEAGRALDLAAAVALGRWLATTVAGAS